AHEAARDLDERGYSPVNLHRSGIGQQHACDDLQQRRLALAVTTDDADRLAGLHREVHVFERPELALQVAALRAREHRLDRPAPATAATKADPEARDLDRVV